MQLSRLQMRNFRRYREAEVRFRDGITGIIGNNGTGKSTIVEAILFCLYGVKETGLDYILRTGAGPRERAEVRLDFSVRGEEYQIVRSLGPGRKHEVHLHREQQLLAQGVTEVQHALREVIRMGHNDFRYTIFSGQRELLSLVGATPEERKKWFRKVLGIDTLKDDGGGILREEVSAAREQVLLIEGRLGETDPMNLRTRQEEIRVKMAATAEALRACEAELEDLEAGRRSLEGDISALRGFEKGVLELRAGILTRQQDLARVREDHARTLREIGELAGYQEEFTALEASEADFEGLRYRLDAGRERKTRFQVLGSGEARAGALALDARKALTRLEEEEALLSRDEGRLGELAPLVARREAAMARLREIRELEGRYQALAASLARTDEALAGAARRGADLCPRITAMREARQRLADLARAAAGESPAADDLLSLLESRHRDILARIAVSAAARDQAAASLAGLEEASSALEARGASGECPTCHQPLGEHYPEIMEHLGAEQDRERERARLALEAMTRAGEEGAALEVTLGEARRLRELSGRLEEVTREWEAVQDLTRRELGSRDRLREEVESLSYDAGERGRLEEETASLDGAWREQAAILDRLARRPALARSRDETGARLEGLEAERAKIAREMAEIGFDPADQARLEAQYQAAEARHRRYLALKPGLDRLPHLGEKAAALTARAGELEGDLGRLEAELAAVPFSPEALAAKERELGGVRQEILGKAEQAAAARVGLAHLAGEEEQLAGLLLKRERDLGERDRLREEIALLELTRDELNGFTDHLLGIVRDQIQGETGRILSEITDGRYDTVLLDDSFELLVHDLGGDFPVSRFSGGEQDDVAIAIRIALSRYIAETHELRDSTFLIFDEIFGSQDEERRANIFRALRALEPYFPQIFLISHISDVQGEFGNTLIVEAVSGNESRIRDLGEDGA